MRRKTKVAIIIYVLVVACFAAVIYLVPSVTGILTPTELLVYGELRETDDAVCYIVRDELVYAADASGNVNYYFEEGTKIRKNTTVLDVTHTGVSLTEASKYDAITERLGSGMLRESGYKTAINGVISYYVDGYETYFTPENMPDMRFETVQSFGVIEPENLVRETVYGGEPIFKIARNDEWYLTCWVDGGSITKYTEGGNVTVRLPNGDVDAVVASVKADGEKWQIVFATDRYYEGFANIRMYSAEIVTSSITGVIVPNRCMTTENGVPGVLVKQKTGEYVFVPIKIKTSDGENSVVYDRTYTDSEGNTVNTVEIYDEILKNPQ